MPRVWVAGSINMDLVARAARHPRPGETVAGTHAAAFPGGKGANQAVAAARLGAETFLAGKVGADAFGDELLAFLAAAGVCVDHVARVGTAPTGVALIVVADSGENTIVVVPGANGQLDSADVEPLPLSRGDVVLCQFEVPLATVTTLLRRARACGATSVLNPAPAVRCAPELLALADVLVVNETELAFFLDGETVEARPAAVADAARRLRRRAEQIVIATLGADGAVAVVGARALRVEGRAVPVVDTTAAGDTFVGALAARLAAGSSIEAALAYANVAAALCVQRPGAGCSIPTAAEVERALAT